MSISLIYNENFLNNSKSLPSFDLLVPMLNKIEHKVINISVNLGKTKLFFISIDNGMQLKF